MYFVLSFSFFSYKIREQEGKSNYAQWGGVAPVGGRGVGESW
jgi:hypothetical protein